MNDKPIRPPQQSDARQARLREALRENLKRRKLQARGRAADAAREPGHEAEIVQDNRRKQADDVV